ncbi:MAG: CBS domain-containing protein, partial [Candidatus Dormibacteraceae bacterium]
FVHHPSLDLYAAVGMAAFIASGYKTPLTAVVFVAEATGGHSYIIPALIGAAVAYAVSGEASASGDQHLHESVKVQELSRIPVSEIMQKQVISVQASSTLRQFADSATGHHRHSVFPVYDDHRMLGTISVWALGRVPPEKWKEMKVGDVLETKVVKVSKDSGVEEALRLLMSQEGHHMLLVTGPNDKLEGVLTKTDILTAFNARATIPKNNHS